MGKRTKKPQLDKESEVVPAIEKRREGTG